MHSRASGLFFAFVLFFAGSESSASVPSGYQMVAAEYGIPSNVLYAVALAESGRWLNGSTTRRPWPWTLNVGGLWHFFTSRHAAYLALVLAIEKGDRPVDIGLMQVNWRYHQGKLGSPSRALDPYRNLRVGAQILLACFQTLKSWWKAVGCYHAPADKHRAARYRERVHRIWLKLERVG